MCKERPKKKVAEWCTGRQKRQAWVWEAGLAAPERFKARSGRGLVC